MNSLHIKPGDIQQSELNKLNFNMYKHIKI